MISGIYKIVNLTNGKMYIGSTVNLNRRKTEHFGKLKKNKHFNRYLQMAWNKYGEEKFDFNVIELINKDNLINREQYWVDHYNVCNRKNGYNIKITVNSNLGMKHSEETKNKIGNSCKNKGRPRTRLLLKIKCESCNNFFETYTINRRFCSLKCSSIFNNTNGISGMKGKHHSEKTKETLRFTSSGENNASKRPEVKEKIREKMIGREITWSYKVKGQKREKTSKSLLNYHKKRRQAP